MNGLRFFFQETRERRFMRVVEVFFSAFSSGRLEEARALCAAPLLWFGRVIDRAGWSTDRARSFHRNAKMKHAKLRSVPGDILAVLKATGAESELFDGPLLGAPVITLIDMTVDGSAVTVGAVVEEIEGEPRIARIFDPSALRGALERLTIPSPAR